MLAIFKLRNLSFKTRLSVHLRWVISNLQNPEFALKYTPTFPG